MNIDSLDLEKVTGLTTKQVCARKYCTYHIGGNFNNFIEVNDQDDLKKLIKYLNLNSLEYKVLGAGSNLLFPDDDLDLCVIKLGKGFRYIENKSSNLFEVGGAFSLMNLSRKLSDQGLSGLEFAGGIPASLGGACRMNAGAHLGEMSDIIKNLSFIDSSGDIVNLNSKEINFEYRNSNLPNDIIITSCIIELVESSKEKTSLLRSQNLEKRKKTQPLSEPSAGSVFKNPSLEKSAGFLIEELGLKDFKIGEAKISLLHANWIVNSSKKAKSIDVKEIISICQSKVKESFDIDLKREIIFW